MRHIVRIIISGLWVFFGLAGSVGPAFADPSCTDWADQGDGTSWRECVNDDGSQHCYTINNAPGSTASEVSCSQ